MKVLKGSRSLVSGGAGFIGSNLVRRLVAEGSKVFVLAKAETEHKRIEDMESNVAICIGDITNQKDVEAAVDIARPDFIFNVAGTRKVERDILLIDPSININLLGVLNFLKALKRLDHSVQTFVQTGTLDEYGIGPVPSFEGQREQPVSPYSASKLAATQFCQMLYRSLQYPIVVLRPCLTYGPAQATDMFIPSLITTALRGEDFQMSSGNQTRDFGYVEDVVDAYVLAALNEKARGEVINISSNQETKIREVAEAIVRLTGGKTKLDIGKLPDRVAEIMHMAGDNSKAKQLLGWSPTTDLETGLNKTIEWYRSHSTN